MTEEQKQTVTLNSLKKAKKNLEEADENLRNTYCEISKFSVVVYTMNTHTIKELTEEIERMENEK
jgi:hypothetical protein